MLRVEAITTVTSGRVDTDRGGDAMGSPRFRGGARGRFVAGPSRMTRLLAPLAAVALLAAGTVLLTVSPAVASTGTWSAPFDPHQNGIYPEAPAFAGMSCLSSNWCMALDQSGDAVFYDGTTWTDPVSNHVDTEVNGNGVSATSISCATTTFCMVVDQLGYATKYSNGKWATPDLLVGGGSSNSGANAVALDSVSCANATFCVAVDGQGEAMTFDGSTWTAPSLVDKNGTNNNALESVSCVSATLCVAVDNEGYAITYNGSTWSGPTLADSYQGNPVTLYSVSCPVPSFCAAVDSLGYAVTFNGSTWAAPQLVASDNSPMAVVSCASAKFCVASVNGGGGSPYFGGVSYYDGTSWSTPVVIDTHWNLSAISCPSLSFCAAGDASVTGYVLTYANSNTVPGAPINVIAEPGDAQATLTWVAPAQGACPITSYVIDIYTGSTLVATITTATNATSDTIAPLTNGTKYTFTVAATNCDGTGPPSTATEPIIPSHPTTPAPYNALSPYRVCDTRAGNPSNLAGTDAQCLGHAIAGGQSLAVAVAGTNPTGQSSGGVPASGATAVILTVTATGGKTNGYLTVYPSGSQAPLASNLNYTAGEAVPNLVEVALGSNGGISIFNSAGSVDVLVDVEGYVGPGPAGAGLFNPITPARICDTRPGNPSGLNTPPDNQCNTLGPLQAGATMAIDVTGAGGVPTTGVGAVALNVTVTGTTSSGWLAVWPKGASRPVTSNLNWHAGQSVPDRVVVPVGASGQVSIYNANGAANVLVDVGGWYSAAGGSGSALTQFSGITPARICDTRNGSGEPYAGQTLTKGATLDVQVGGVGGVPANVTAVVLNVTVTGTTSAGYLTVWPQGATQPTSSDLNWAAGESVPNLVIVGVSASGKVSFFNANGSTDVIADVVGWYQ